MAINGSMDLPVTTTSSTTSSTTAVDDASVIMYNGVACTPKRAKANIAASTTDGAVVAAVTSKIIHVIGYQLLAGGTATDATFTTKPGGAGTAVSMLHACGVNSGISSGTNIYGYFRTASGEGLSLTTGAGSTVGVQVEYIEI